MRYSPGTFLGVGFRTKVKTTTLTTAAVAPITTAPITLSKSPESVLGVEIGDEVGLGVGEGEGVCGGLGS